MGLSNTQARIIQAWLPLVMAFLLLAIPAGAQDGSVANMVAELTPKAGQSGFAGLAVSKARELNNLTDSVTLILELLTISTNPADSRDLYIEMASIQELLGRYEEAARSWEAAAAAQPGKGEPSWLLSAAACKLVIGDAETAAALSKAAKLTTANPRLIALAMLIEARTMILSGDKQEALARSMDALALESSGLEAAALALARDVSSGTEREAYGRRLRDEYPGWPEVLDCTAPVYTLVHLTPARIMESRTPSVAAAETTRPHLPAVTQEESAAVTVASPLYYQLGAFRDEANAELLSIRLSRAGFQPKTAKRDSGVGVLAIVYLEAGSDPARLMIALKDAGFESWPLFAAP